MKAPHFLFALLASSAYSLADLKFEQDRAAILGMAGEFKVSFTFQETVSLTDSYEIKNPYHADAREVVKVVEDKGSEITLQHLLVVEDMDGANVIKHWAQIWKFEDTITLDYEGDMTWVAKKLSQEEAKGTWTQFVTQVDDSPRYKAAGKWEHNGNYSAWTSMPSTRPLPRREYTKRSDYDLLKVVNRHIITPEGWVHLQDNRKFVRRNGLNKSLCLETGINSYKRIMDPDEFDETDFAAADLYWEQTHEFWAEVRTLWNNIIVNADSPIHYEAKVEKISDKPLMMRMWDLAEKFTEDPESASSTEIFALINEHRR